MTTIITITVTEMLAVISGCILNLYWRFCQFHLRISMARLLLPSMRWIFVSGCRVIHLNDKTETGWICVGHSGAPSGGPYLSIEYKSFFLFPVRGAHAYIWAPQDDKRTQRLRPASRLRAHNLRHLRPQSWPLGLPRRRCFTLLLNSKSHDTMLLQLYFICLFLLYTSLCDAPLSFEYTQLFFTIHY